MARFPKIMGVLNVTPDSFSDGGQYSNVDAAVVAAGRMLDEGADIIDIGGESTRPGAVPVSVEEELRRVVPVVQAMHERFPEACLSIDTQKAVVAQAALECGASIVNDVSAGSDSQMHQVVARADAHYVLMHMQGDPRTMQNSPSYDDAVAEVVVELTSARDAAIEAGVSAEKIWLDPGIGFGKRDTDNLALLDQLDQLAALGHPVLIGVSRKSIIGRLLGGVPPAQCLEGSLALAARAVQAGAQIVRVHDVAATKRFFTCWLAGSECQSSERCIPAIDAAGQIS